MSSNADRVAKSLFKIKLRSKRKRRNTEHEYKTIKMHPTANTKYCWECYKSGANCDCAKCKKTFHKKCFSIKYSPFLWTCRECIILNLEQKKRKPSQVEVPSLNELLQIVETNLKLDDCIKLDLMPIVQKRLPPNSDISHPLGLLKSDKESIKKKLKKKKYKSVHTFSYDIKMMIYNFFTALDFSDEHYTDLQTWSKKVLDRCKGDIQCLELCEDCFKNLSTNDVDWFTNVCSKRHRVVWAAKGKYPSWPAKVMLVEEDIISVQFFGDHSTARVMAEEVVPYYREYLNKNIKHREALNECLPELNRYLENLGHGNDFRPYNAEHLDESDPFNSTFNKFKSELPSQYKVQRKRSHDLKKQNESLEIELKRIRIEFSKLQQEKINLTAEIGRLEVELEHTKEIKTEFYQTKKYDELKLTIANITAERDKYKKKLDTFEEWKKRGDWEN